MLRKFINFSFSKTKVSKKIKDMYGPIKEIHNSSTPELMRKRELNQKKLFCVLLL